jgi:hyaluronoglucosaminidase
VRARRALATAAALAVVAAACSGGGGDDGDAGDDRGGSAVTTVASRPRLEPRADPLPAVLPTPHEMAWLGPDVPVTERVQVVVAPEVDEPTRALVTTILEEAGAEVAVEESLPPQRDHDGAGDPDPTATEGTVDERAGEADDSLDRAAEGSERVGRQEAGGDDAGLVLRLGPASDPDVAGVLEDAGVAPPRTISDEGYVLATVAYAGEAPGQVVIAAHAPTGWFYGAQSLRQLTSGGAVAGVSVTDQAAAIPIRGSIEGFYGSPWTHEERLDQLAFYGRVKLNTYVYAPKDDPYHRDRWREPYPAAEVDRLRQLIDTARANHVRFTFAVSPGVSLCFSDPADTDALVAKLQALYDLGVRTFAVAFDDIVADRWNCAGDQAAYGAPSMEAAARAQGALLGQVRERIVGAHDDVGPLQMVPTDYRGTRDSGYRTALRSSLAGDIQVMWTGTYVVPPAITVAEAQAAAGTYGRPALIWDNTPVNDFPATEGRLLLGPYTRREPGLAAQVSGIVLNPMNQAAASKVALAGASDFTWNDAAYDPARAHRAAAALLAGDPTDQATIDALLAFFDTENLAPTSASSGELSQPQSPALAARLDAFRSTWGAGDQAGALAALRPYAELLAGAPARIREHAEPGFVSDAGPWLEALDGWGAAFVATLDALEARRAGDEGTAAAKFTESSRLVAQAGAVHTIEGETRPQGPVRVADGVLDTFLAEAQGLR